MPERKPWAEIVLSIADANNSEIDEVCRTAERLLSHDQRLRLIERLSSLIGAVTETIL